MTEVNILLLACCWLELKGEMLYVVWTVGVTCLPAKVIMSAFMNKARDWSLVDICVCVVAQKIHESVSKKRTVRFFQKLQQVCHHSLKMWVPQNKEKGG